LVNLNMAMELDGHAQLASFLDSVNFHHLPPILGPSPLAFDTMEWIPAFAELECCSSPCLYDLDETPDPGLVIKPEPKSPPPPPPPAPLPYPTTLTFNITDFTDCVTEPSSPASTSTSSAPDSPGHKMIMRRRRAPERLTVARPIPKPRSSKYTMPPVIAAFWRACHHNLVGDQDAVLARDYSEPSEIAIVILRPDRLMSVINAGAIRRWHYYQFTRRALVWFSGVGGHRVPDGPLRLVLCADPIRRALWLSGPRDRGNPRGPLSLLADESLSGGNSYEEYDEFDD
jgi:hypothetical protein